MNDLGCNEKHSTLFPGQDGDSDRTKYFEEIKKQIYQRYVPYGLKKNAGGNTYRWGTIGNNSQIPNEYYVPLDGGNIETYMVNNNFDDLFEEVL
jgi:hypothetical protein